MPFLKLFSAALAAGFTLALLIGASDPKASTEQAAARVTKTFAPYASSVNTRSDGQYF